MRVTLTGNALDELHQLQRRNFICIFLVPLSRIHELLIIPMGQNLWQLWQILRYPSDTASSEILYQRKEITWKAKFRAL